MIGQSPHSSPMIKVSMPSEQGPRTIACHCVAHSLCLAQLENAIHEGGYLVNRSDQVRIKKARKTFKVKV